MNPTEKIPITLGIVGHRDIQFTDKHREVIKKILDELHRRYPYSPVVLFSQLAVGADTEVAKVFLDVKKRTGRDYRLVVPLPFDREYYEKNQFTTDDELRTFQDLLARAERWFVLRPLSDNLKALLDANPQSFPEELNAHFRFGGEFIADSSIVFMALWDMSDNKLEGGSAHIVNYKKQGAYYDKISEKIFDKTGSLIEIPCNRLHQNNSLYFQEDYMAELLKDTTIKKSLDKVEELNSADISPELLQRNKQYLFPENKVPDENARRLRDYYALADTLALHHQNKYLLVLKALFVLGFIIYTGFEIYKHLGLISTVLVITLGLIGFAYGIFKRTVKWKNHKKYIENRILAEALRVQFFWYLAGINEPVSRHILRIHTIEFRWLKHLLSAIYGLTFAPPKTKVSTELITKHWIEDQKNYFQRKIDLFEKSKKTYDIISYITLALGFILLIVIAFTSKNEHWKHYREWLIVADSMLFGFFALIKAYYEKRGYEEVKEQYRLMRNIYNSAFDQLKQLNSMLNVPGAKKLFLVRQILFTTGKEALVENGNWYAVYKDKKPELEGIG